MASENANNSGSRDAESTSENTTLLPPVRRGRAALALSDRYRVVLDEYVAALRSAPLSDQTRRTYESKVRQFLAWLAQADVDGDPLNAADARDWAAREYRTHLQTVLKRKPATVNNALAAIDDLYTRRRLGPANATRADLPKTAPKALTKRAAIRFLRAVEAWPSARDRAIALVPFYAGARIGEIVGLDVDDVHLSARKGVLRISGKGERIREIPIHPPLRVALTNWLDERVRWPGADGPGLFLNRRGARISARAAHEIITTIAHTAAPDDNATAHVLRHTFATRLVRGRTDLVIVAELLGHARLETTRVYSRPTREDAERTLDRLDVDS